MKRKSWLPILWVIVIFVYSPALTANESNNAPNPLSPATNQEDPSQPAVPADSVSSGETAVSPQRSSAEQDNTSHFMNGSGITKAHEIPHRRIFGSRRDLLAPKDRPNRVSRISIADLPSGIDPKGVVAAARVVAPRGDNAALIVVLRKTDQGKYEIRLYRINPEKGVEEAGGGFHFKSKHQLRKITFSHDGRTIWIPRGPSFQTKKLIGRRN